MNPESSDSISYIPSDTIEEASFTSRKGEPYWVLCHTKRQTYLRLNPEEYSIWNQIKTGISRDVLTYASLKKFPSYSLHQIQDFIGILLDLGFIYHQELKKQVAIQKEADSWITHYWELLIPLPGIGRIIDVLDTSIGWVLRLRWFPWLFLIFCLAGLSYFVITEPLPSYPVLLGDDSQLVTVLSIYLILISAAILHVFGHAMACKTYGRSIGDAGLILYYGMPGLYIDTSDIWMAERKSRVIVSLSGPAVNLFIGACCALLVLAFPDSEPNTLLWRVAFLSFAVALINLNPLLEFDGYYALTDLLEIPDLRTRAFTFLRSFSPSHFHQGKEGLFLLIYGVASAIFTLAIVIVGIYFWKEHMTDLLNELSKDRWEMDNILATLAIVIVFVPFFVGMMISGYTKIVAYMRERKSKENQKGIIQVNDEIYSHKQEQPHTDERVLTRRLSK